MFVFRTTRKKPSTLTRLILAVAASVAIQGCGDSADQYVFTGSPAATAAQTRQLSIYMVGSNLESQGNAGTTDFNEMVTGLRTLSDQQRQALDLRIAFGGADKAGWRGVKWMNQEQLLRDAEDGVYGNETDPDSYLFVDETANMGEPATLTRFLDMMGQTTSAPESRFVILWDHGGAYRGYGPDEVFDKSMTLDELDAAFAGSSLPKLDMIGFDACLMANLEVGKAMQPHGDRLIASEELEPGHGWDYRYVVPAFVTSADIDRYARGLIDNYVDSANHPQAVLGKCLSVVDLTAYGQLQAALDSYSSAYSAELLPIGPTAVGFVRATTQAQPYASRGDSRIALDLLDFVNQSVFFAARSAAASESLLAAIENYVINTNDDGSLTAGGVSIIPPDLTGENLAQANYAGAGWFGLVQASVVLIGSDVAPPQLSGVTVTPDGIVATFADALLTRVSAVYGLQTADGGIQVLGTDIATRVGNTNEWSIEGWDGETVHLDFASGSAPYPVPLIYGRVVIDGAEPLVVFYSRLELSEARASDKSFRRARLSFYFRLDGTIASHDLVAETIDSEGNVTIDKVERGLSVGDRVRFSSEQLSVGPQQASEQTWTTGPELVLQQTPRFPIQMVTPPAGTDLVFAIVGQDFTRNTTVSVLQPLIP